MKYLLAAAAVLAATPVFANWDMQRLPTDVPSFAVFTNDFGRLSGDDTPTNEILIMKSEANQTLGADGSCSFDNCTVSIVIEGQRPAAGQRVDIYFSQGDLMEFPAAGGDHIFANTDWDGKQITNQFVRSVGRAEWVIIRFGNVSHRFSLSGSTDAFEAVAAAVN